MSFTDRGISETFHKINLHKEMSIWKSHNRVFTFRSLIFSLAPFDPDSLRSKDLKTTIATIIPLMVPHTTLQKTSLGDISSSSSGTKSIYHVALDDYFAFIGCTQLMKRDRNAQ